jgi:hypothetical protein
MIPYNALLKHPERYRPLGSVKAVNNVPSSVDFTNISINALFTSQPNIAMLTSKLYKVARQNGNRSSIEKFKKLVPMIAMQFKTSNTLEEYETAETGAVGFNNWVEVLKTVNNEFMKYCYNRLKWNTFVPTREWAEVGPRHDRKQTKFYELQAADHGTMDLWSNQETQIMNKHFRYGNKIPFWQSSMHKRHYDRQNEGLAYDNPDRASLDTPVYGYNMDNVRATVDKWQSEEWFGM